MKQWILRLLDPTLGAKVRAVLRILISLGVLGSIIIDEEVVVAALVAVQGILAILVLTPTTAPAPPAPPAL